MFTQHTIKKINKWKIKRKSSDINELMNPKRTDPEILCAALEALAAIGDEPALNQITHYLNHPNPQVRLTACRVAISIGSEYMRTRVFYQLSLEKDENLKEQIRDAYNEQYH